MKGEFALMKSQLKHVGFSLLAGTVALASTLTIRAEDLEAKSAEAIQNFKMADAGLTNFFAKANVAASGAAANAKYEQGVAVFTLPKSGAMVAAAIGGQKFKFEPLK